MVQAVAWLSVHPYIVPLSLVQELHDMFYDMALLVEEQGEMIDRIEHNVELAAAHVEVGQQNIRRAAEYSRTNRRVSWKWS